MNNILRVGELICMIGKVEGRKRLQKTVYILQQMGFPFSEDFEYGHFGPYSTTLAAELEVLKLNHLVQETSQDYSHGTEYAYAPTEELEKALEDDPGLRSLDDAGLRKVLSILAAYKVPVLEVASSRVFLRQSGFTGEQLDSALKAWKSGLEPYFGKANELLAKVGLKN
jgi:hypothetical protein